MSDFNFETAVNGPAAQNRKATKPFALLKKVMAQASDPHDKEAVRRAFMAAAMPADLLEGINDPAMRFVFSMCNDWFDYHYKYAVADFPKVVVVVGKSQQAKQAKQQHEAKRQEMVAKQKARAEKLAAYEAKFDKGIERKTKLLAMVMPDGKKFAEWTDVQCRQAGGWLVAVADRVGAGGVVGTIPETELRAMAPQDFV